MEGNEIWPWSVTRPNRPGLPVILVTGHPSLETAIPSIHLAVMAYLRKPVDYARIREQIRVATEHSTLHRTMTEIHQRLSTAAAEIAASQGQLSAPSEPAQLVTISLVATFRLHLRKCCGCAPRSGYPGGNQTLCRLLDCNIPSELRGRDRRYD